MQLKKTDNRGLSNCVIENGTYPLLFDFQLKSKAKRLLSPNIGIDFGRLSVIVFQLERRIILEKRYSYAKFNFRRRRSYELLLLSTTKLILLSVSMDLFEYYFHD